MNTSNYNRKYFEIAILLGMLCALYAPAFLDLARAWDNKPQSSHGYLVIPICLYLVYTMRQEIVKIKLEQSTTGILFVIAGIGLYIIGTLAKISTLSNVSLLLNIIGIQLGLGGTIFLRKLLFPTLFLVFMFPIPDSIYISLTAPLKLFTSSVSVKILQMSGIPVLQEGNIIQLPNMMLEVVEACSGLRSLTSYIILGVLLAYLTPSSGKMITVIIIATAFPISIAVNVLRIVGTGALAMHLGPKVAKGFFHEFSGIIVFIVGMVLYLGLYSFLRDMKKHLFQS